MNDQSILEVQRYLRSGKTLNDLVSDYAIKVTPREPVTGDLQQLVCLNYDQIASPMNATIARECRGLILERDTWNVISRSFGKFFNIQEGYAAAIDWDSARVYEKLDGSLISVYFYKGEWRVATRGTVDASGPLGDRSCSFRDLVNTVIGEAVGPRHDASAFFAQLDPDLFYSFELTTPENCVVVPYKNRRLTLLGVWRRQDLSEIALDDVPNLPYARKALQYIVGSPSADNLISLVNAMSATEHEGVVVVDKYFNRVKIKASDYIRVTRVVSSLRHNRAILDFVLSDQADDSMSLLPSIYQERVKGMQTRLHDFLDTIKGAYDQFKDLETRKEYAQAILSHPDPKIKVASPILFKLRDGQTLSDALRSLTSRALLSALGVDDNEDVAESENL